MWRWCAGRGLRPWFKPQHCLDVLGRSQSESESHSLLCKTRVTSTRPKRGGICELLDVEKPTIFSVLHKSVVSLRWPTCCEPRDRSRTHGVRGWGGLGDVSSDGFCRRKSWVLGRVVCGRFCAWNTPLAVPSNVQWQMLRIPLQWQISEPAASALNYRSWRCLSHGPSVLQHGQAYGKNVGHSVDRELDVGEPDSEPSFAISCTSVSSLAGAPGN